jgi:predicted DNA binding CopG/RHH family protein
MNKLKKLPKFASEDAEREFWATHSGVDYLDWDKAVINPSMPNLKPSSEVISLRLPLSLLDTIKIEAHQRDIPYQSYIKVKLDEAFGRKR